MGCGRHSCLHGPYYRVLALHSTPLGCLYIFVGHCCEVLCLPRPISPTAASAAIEESDSFEHSSDADDSLGGGVGIGGPGRGGNALQLSDSFLSEDNEPSPQATPMSAKRGSSLVRPSPADVDALATTSKCARRSTMYGAGTMLSVHMHIHPASHFPLHACNSALRSACSRLPLLPCRCLWAHSCSSLSTRQHRCRTRVALVHCCLSVYSHLCSHAACVHYHNVQ